jgi:hypothetical protein
MMKSVITRINRSGLIIAREPILEIPDAPVLLLRAVS